jgi:hypothetical protein
VLVWSGTGRSLAAPPFAPSGQVTYVPAYLGDRGARSATRLRRDPPRPGAVGEGPCGSLTSPGLASARPQGRGEPARLEVCTGSLSCESEDSPGMTSEIDSDERSTSVDREYWYKVWFGWLSA